VKAISGILVGVAAFGLFIIGYSALALFGSGIAATIFLDACACAIGDDSEDDD
jgi:hypothetical protein